MKQSKKTDKGTVGADLESRYENICNEYIKLFCSKQGIDFDFWMGGKVGGCASFCEQYSFNLQDIIWDINNKCKKGLILQWQNDYIENQDKKMINYFSYSKGLRFKDFDKVISKV